MSVFQLHSALNIVNGYIIGKADTINKLWCTYEHYVTGPSGRVMIFVGCCRLPQVYEYPDARRNSEWVSMFKGSIDLEIRIAATSLHRHECLNHAFDLINLHQPYCNKNGILLGNAKSVVVCVETGVSYESAAKCAKAEGLSEAALSRHLNGHAGFASIKGKTYRRGTL